MPTKVFRPTNRYPLIIEAHMDPSLRFGILEKAPSHGLKRAFSPPPVQPWPPPSSSAVSAKPSAQERKAPQSTTASLAPPTLRRAAVRQCHPPWCGSPPPQHCAVSTEQDEALWLRQAIKILTTEDTEVHREDKMKLSFRSAYTRGICFLEERRKSRSLPLRGSG